MAKLQVRCNYSSITAYPALPDPPVETMKMIFAIAGQKESVVLSSNVQSSNTGQVRVTWRFAGTAGSSRTYFPNGEKNSLILVNLTTADNGDYTPQASSSSMPNNLDWSNVNGQIYRLRVDIFGELYYTYHHACLACIFALYIDQPRFTRNLTCNEEPGQLWRCITQATGTDIKYQWFINNELLSTKDNRVSSMVRSSIVLHNLEPSDMHLMVQVYNTKDQRTYRIAQSAAI